MVGLQTLDLAIGVRVPASQPVVSGQNRTVVVFMVAVIRATTLKKDATNNGPFLNIINH